CSGQLATICRAVCLHLLVDSLLLIFELGGFTSGQLATLDSLRNAVLLIFAALADFVISVVGRVGVVLVVVDLVRQLILLLVDLLFFGLRQLPTIGCTIRTRLTVNGRFFRFEIGSFASRQLPALDAVGNPVLLVFLPLCDGWILRRRAGGGRSLRHRYGSEQ